MSKTNYSQLVSKSSRELAQWLDKNGQHDDSPWMTWFDKKYCSKCEPVTITAEEARSRLGLESWFNQFVECAYCELYNNCKYFTDMKEIPANVEIIEMWLKEEE